MSANATEGGGASYVEMCPTRFTETSRNTSPAGTVSSKGSGRSEFGQPKSKGVIKGILPKNRNNISKKSQIDAENDYVYTEFGERSYSMGNLQFQKKKWV